MKKLFCILLAFTLCKSTICRADDVNAIDSSDLLLGSIACGSHADCDLDAAAFKNITVNPVAKPGVSITDSAKEACRAAVKKMIGQACGVLYTCAGCPDGQTGCEIGWANDDSHSPDDLPNYTVSQNRNGSFSCTFSPNGGYYDALVKCSECKDCAKKQD